MQIDISHMCNFLNELAQRNPALMEAVMSTNWTCDASIHPAVEFVSAGDMYVTHMLGIFNGAIGASGYRINVKKVGNYLAFLPVEVSDPNSYSLVSEINANSISTQEPR